MKTICIQVNGNLPGYAVGQEVRVAADNEGTPLDQFWRRRLKDAKTDKCCEVVNKRAVARKKSKERSN